MSDGVALTVLDGEESDLPVGEATNADMERPGADGPGILIDGLAKMPERTLLDETRLAAVLGISGRTIRRMVSRGELPPPVSFGGRSVWFANRVLDHLDAAFERVEKEANQHAARIRALTN